MSTAADDQIVSILAAVVHEYSGSGSVIFGPHVAAIRQAIGSPRDSHCRERGADLFDESPQPQSSDDASLREKALSIAAGTSSPYDAGSRLVERATTMLTFLQGRDYPTPSPAEILALGNRQLGAAPAALHEALDRAWRSIIEDEDRLAIDSDGDDEILEQLRTLTDGERARTLFVLVLTRSLTKRVRAERRGDGD